MFNNLRKSFTSSQEMKYNDDLDFNNYKVEEPERNLEEQRKIAQQQLFIYQQMVEAELKTDPCFDFEKLNFQSSNFNPYHPKKLVNTANHSSYGQLSSTTTSQPLLGSYIYQVQFKAASRYYVTNPMSKEAETTAVGDFVIVEAERGHDLGVVTAMLTTQQFTEKRLYSPGINAENSRVRRIIRGATLAERQTLPDKHIEEESVFEYCCQLVMTVHALPIKLYSAEYQFDKKKLTIYYDSAGRVDFRALVRDLYAAFKVRIWMEKINLQEERSKIAMIALTTGVLSK